MCADSLKVERLSYQIKSRGSNPTSALQYLVKEIPKEQTYEWLLKKHYAHRIPSLTRALGLYNETLQGVLTFGMPPCHFNNGGGIFKDYSVNTLELTRLVINDGLPANTASFFISHSINLLEKPLCLVSFADPNNGHHGYIYQATNWLYTGLSQKGGKDKQWIYQNREYHGKTITIEWMKQFFKKYDDKLNMKQNWILNGGIVEENEERKFRYIYFHGNKSEKQSMREHLALPILPYPKGDNKRYDTSYSPPVQLTF